MTLCVLKFKASMWLFVDTCVSLAVTPSSTLLSPAGPPAYNRRQQRLVTAATPKM